jgi:hypothetical protein
MKHGCLALSGLGLTSLFVFGVTLEAINDPKELSAIPFTPWDFITYGLIAIAIPALVLIVRKRDPRKTLPGKWTSHVTHSGARFRTTLRLDPDGNAEIQTKETAADSEQKLHTSARWQLLDDRTLNLSGTQSATWKILKLNALRMTTASPADLGFSIRWTKHPTINAKACLVITMAVLLPILFALSLPRSGASHGITDDPRYVPSNTSYHSHR